MEDGRQIIEETNRVVVEISKGLEGLKTSFPAETYSQFERSVGLCVKWVKLCRGKVWLRSKEGTDLAKGCLEAANRLKTSLGDPAAAQAAAAALAKQLELTARTIEANAQIIT